MTREQAVPSAIGVYRVRRAWPRHDELALELVGPGGVVTPARLRGNEPVEVGRAGNDPALPGLARAVAESGGSAAVIGHRPGRRAVLTCGEQWVKVVRPGTAMSISSRHVALSRLVTDATAGVRVATLEYVDGPAGTLTFAALAGRPMLRHADVVAVASRVGSALSRWQQLTPPFGLDRHDARREIDVLARWANAAQQRGLIAARRRRSFEMLVADAVAALGSLGRRPEEVLSHRDLHDAQVLVDDAGEVGFLDLDTVAVADPALDIGNLLAHLDLAVATGAADASTIGSAGEALTRAAVGDRGDAAAIRAYRLAAVARLVAVHAFRPGSREAAATLVDGRAAA